MIDEVIDAFGWDRMHAIKTLNGKVTHWNKSKKIRFQVNTSKCPEPARSKSPSVLTRKTTPKIQP